MLNFAALDPIVPAAKHTLGLVFFRRVAAAARQRVISLCDIRCFSVYFVFILNIIYNIII